MDDIKAKQQVVEKIKEASKILVTVSNSPSVDALSAALGLTLLFDKQEKYATAIFSGEVPPAIAFLEPEKTFDETTDSLRDFIIALNKEKADHLRYKVEGDSVKIFITPYKTTIDKDDLEFSQGDYNVELVIALGVDNQDHLDKALEDHGQILHDATVITISAGDQSSDLGGIDWHDANASSLSEMVAGLAEALKDDKKSLVDAQIATALLTGIVAQTDRFSNQHTTSKVMTVAAQLMSAGADQQLIATELQTPAPTPEVVEEKTEENQETEDLDEIADDGSQGNISIKKDELLIAHDEPKETLAELDERFRTKDEEPEEVAETIDVEQPEQESTAEEPVVEPQPEAVAPEPTVEPEVQPVSEPVTETLERTILPDLSSDPNSASSAYALDEDDLTPSLGGTLNATSEQAAEDSHREALGGQNKTILSHGGVSSEPAQISNPIEATPVGFPGTPSVAPGSLGINGPDEDLHSAYALAENSEGATSAANSAPTFGAGSEIVITPPAAPVAPVDLGLPLPPPLPDFSQGPLAPPPTFPAMPPLGTSVPQPEILGDILAPEPAAYEPIPTEPTSAYSIDASALQPPSDNPAQFKIPG